MGTPGLVLGGQPSVSYCLRACTIVSMNDDEKMPNLLGSFDNFDMCTRTQGGVLELSILASLNNHLDAATWYFRFVSTFFNTALAEYDNIISYQPRYQSGYQWKNQKIDRFLKFINIKLVSTMPYSKKL